MLYDKVQTAIEAYVHSNWTALNVDAIAYDNAPIKSDLYEEWGRCSIIFGDAQQRSLGLAAVGEYRQTGIVLLSIFVKPATGAARLNELLASASKVLTSVEIPPVLSAGVAAFSDLTSSGFFADGDIVVINSRIYTMRTVLTTAANDVLIGTNLTDGINNLAKAINGSGVAGTNYSAATTANTDVTATVSGSVMTVHAKTVGVQGNSITVSAVSALNSWSNTPLKNGEDRAVLTPAVIFKVPTAFRDLNEKHGWVMAQTSTPFYYDLEQ